MTPVTDAAYSIRPARHAKGKVAVTAYGTADGYKTRACRLAQALARGRYTGREHAYIMGPKTAARFEKLYAQGWDANGFSYELEAPHMRRELDRAMDRLAPVVDDHNAPLRERCLTKRWPEDGTWLPVPAAMARYNDHLRDDVVMGAFCSVLRKDLPVPRYRVAMAAAGMTRDERFAFYRECGL